MVSADNGFALAGTTYDNIQNGREHDFQLLKINSRGELLWGQRYDWGRNDEREHAYGLAQLEDGGYILVGHQISDDHSTKNPAVVRTYGNGQMRWQRIYPFSDDDEFRDDGNAFMSVVKGDEGCTMVSGVLNLNDNNRTYDGILLKIEPDIIGPMVFYWSPEDTLFSALVGDTVSFIVRARNQLGLEMGYEWFRGGEHPISRDTTVTVVFDEIGDDSLLCVITDEEESASINWRIDVTGMYIDSHTPDSLDFIIRRNTTIDFVVTSRTVNDDPVEYAWLLNDVVVSDLDSVSIRFERGREHTVTAVASQGDLSDSVTWQVMVNDLIVDYIPEQFDLSVPIDTTFEFEVFPFNPNDDSLRFIWTVNGDSVWNRSWLLMNFGEEGMYNITAHVSDTTESDSLTWEVNVQPTSIHTDAPRHPDTATLYPPTPNPFNSVTTVRYYLPTASDVKLSLFDVNGRLVMELVDGYRTIGEHAAVIDGSGLVSGVYFVRMIATDPVKSQKVLLLK